MDLLYLITLAAFLGALAVLAYAADRISPKVMNWLMEIVTR
jgi:hypothetical protein